MLSSSEANKKEKSSSISSKSKENKKNTHNKQKINQNKSSKAKSKTTANAPSTRHKMKSACAAYDYKKMKACSTSDFKRDYHRRPDRHPFIVEIASPMFFPTRGMSKMGHVYPTVVSESFWRVAAYIDSVPARVESRIKGKSPNVMIRGRPGCGKSFLITACCALLGFGPQSFQPSKLQYMNNDYRAIHIGDCKEWLEWEDPLTFFRTEFLTCFRDDARLRRIKAGDRSAINEPIDHSDPDHLGCLFCVPMWTRLEHVKAFIDRSAHWLRLRRPDTSLVFFFDQAEALIDKEDSIPYHIVSMLIDAQFPLLVFGVTCPLDRQFPFTVGTVINAPFRCTSLEFQKHIEIDGPKEISSFNEDGTVNSRKKVAAAGCGDDHPIEACGNILYNEPGHWKDVRLWTGCIPGEIQKMIQISAKSIPEKFYIYRRQSAAAVGKMLGKCAGFEGKKKNILLIVIFAIILRVPLDTSGEFTIDSIYALGPEFCSLIVLDCIHAFYHSTDGIISMKNVPMAINLAHHLALCSTASLSAIVPIWDQLFESVVHAMINSKLLCIESKRRMSRFYVHARLLWGRDCSNPDLGPWSFRGESELMEPIAVKPLYNPRIIVFAGQTPHPSYILDDKINHGTTASPPSATDYDSTVFLSGRTGYWFFDAFVWIPSDRRLYAITTSSVVTTWLHQLQQSKNRVHNQDDDDGLLTPLILLDHWREVLRAFGYGKVSVRCVFIEYLELMKTAGYRDTLPEQGASSGHHHHPNCGSKDCKDGGDNTAINQQHLSHTLSRAFEKSCSLSTK